MAEVERYDFVVIGGGSGGISAASAAANAGAKVALFDYVDPTPHGTTWGLGGTCVNVGCIPKKLFHSASLMGEVHKDMPSFGWQVDTTQKINWTELVERTQNHIKSVNFAYRVSLRSAKVNYINAKARFEDAHTIAYEDRKGQVHKIHAENVLISVGGRPNIPREIPGIEHAVTSDDIFSWEKEPGKTLVVGASYIALECAGFLTGFGYDTSVLVRSVPLRLFDQQMAKKIVDYMEHVGTKFVHGGVIEKIEKVDDKLNVTINFTDGRPSYTETFETVLMAIGRYAVTQDIHLEKAGVAVAANGKVLVNEKDQSSVPHIYAVGDCAEGIPELTPVAVQAGKLLAERLFAGKNKLMDYINVATTVFTPIEYGAIGYSEEAAIAKFGDENIEVYHMQATPYEQTLIEAREEFPAYVKLIVNKADDERVIGFHVTAPGAGEITQGFAVAMKLRATKQDLDDTVGIHPTTAELFTQLNITKRSGKALPKGGCPSCAST